MSQTRTNTNTSTNRRGGGYRGGGAGGRGAGSGGGGGRGGARGGQPNHSNNNRNQGGSSGPKPNNFGNRGQYHGTRFKPRGGRGANHGRGSNNSREPASWGTVAGNFLLNNHESLLNLGSKVYDMYTEYTDKKKRNGSNFTETPDNSESQTSFNSSRSESFQPWSSTGHHQERHPPEDSNNFQHRPNTFDSSRNQYPYQRSHYHSSEESNPYQNHSEFNNFHYPYHNRRGNNNHRGNRDFSEESRNSFGRPPFEERFKSGDSNNYENTNFNNGNSSFPSHRNNVPDNNFPGNNVSPDPIGQSSPEFIGRPNYFRGTKNTTNPRNSGSFSGKPVSSNKSPEIAKSNEPKVISKISNNGTFTHKDIAKGSPKVEPGTSAEYKPPEASAHEDIPNLQSSADLNHFPNPKKSHSNNATKPSSSAQEDIPNLQSSADLNNFPNVKNSHTNTNNVIKPSSSNADSVTSTKSKSWRPSEFEDIPRVSNVLNLNGNKAVKTRSFADIEKRKKILQQYGFLMSMGSSERSQETATPPKSSEDSLVSQNNSTYSIVQNVITESNELETLASNLKTQDPNEDDKSRAHSSEKTIGEKLITQTESIVKAPPEDENTQKHMNNVITELETLASKIKCQDPNEHDKSRAHSSVKTIGEKRIAQTDINKKAVLQDENTQKHMNIVPQNSDKTTSSQDTQGSNKPDEPIILDFSKQMDNYKSELQSQKAPGYQRRMDNRKFDSKGATKGNKEAFSHKDNLTQGQFSGVPHFNIQRPAADRHDRVPSQSDARRRRQRDHDVEAAIYQEKEKEKAAKKRDQYLARYSHVDQGYRMTEGPLDRNGFDQTQARMRQDEARLLQQERLRKDALAYQQLQEEEKARQRVIERQKRQEWMDKQHVDAGYRLGSGDGRRHSREETGYPDEQYDNEYNEDLYGEYVEDEQRYDGAYNLPHQRDENEYQRQAGDRGYQMPSSQRHGNIGFEHWQGAERRGGGSQDGRRSQSPSNARESSLLRAINPALMLEGETEAEFNQRQEEQLIIETLILSQLGSKEDDGEDEIVKRVMEQSKMEARINQNVNKPTSNIPGAGKAASTVTSSAAPSAARNAPPQGMANQQMRPSAPPQAVANQQIRPSAPHLPPDSGTSFAQTPSIFKPNSSLPPSSKPANNYGSGAANSATSSGGSSDTGASVRKPAPQTFNEMKQFFIPNSNNQSFLTSEALLVSNGGPNAEKEEAEEDNDKSADKAGKDKSKKRWSFSSIDFSRKDKSKPNVSKYDAENDSTTNEEPVAEEALLVLNGGPNAEKEEAEEDNDKSADEAGKDKPKKRWSFRSISFSSKDKSKPNVSKYDVENDSITNEEPVAEGPSAAKSVSGSAESPRPMARSQSQPDAIARAPAGQVIRSNSQGTTLVLRQTEEALNKALAEKLIVIEEMDKRGYSTAYKPNVQPDPQFSNNRFDKSYQRPVDIGRVTGAIPKKKTPTSPTTSASSENQNEIDHQAEMRAARLRMQQKYEESLRAKQDNQDST